MNGSPLLKMALGTDVQDLREPDCRRKSEDHRFRSRVFTHEEERNINEADDPDGMLWLIWTCKESAFKAIRAHFPDEKFSWKSYRVSSDLRSVQRDAHLLSCRTLLKSQDMAFSVCFGSVKNDTIVPADEREEEVRWRIESLERISNRTNGMVEHTDSPGHDPEYESRITRILIMQFAAEILAMEVDRFFVDRQIPPRLLLDGKILPYALSLSHHGGYGACALHMIGHAG